MEIRIKDGENKVWWLLDTSDQFTKHSSSLPGLVETACLVLRIRAVIWLAAPSPYRCYHNLQFYKNRNPSVLKYLGTDSIGSGSNV